MSNIDEEIESIFDSRDRNTVNQNINEMLERAEAENTQQYEEMQMSMGPQSSQIRNIMTTSTDITFDGVNEDTLTVGDIIHVDMSTPSNLRDNTVLGSEDGSLQFAGWNSTLEKGSIRLFEDQLQMYDGLLWVPVLLKIDADGTINVEKLSDKPKKKTKRKNKKIKSAQKGTRGTLFKLRRNLLCL